MNKYYFTFDIVRKGPFSIEQLKEKKLSHDTFVWANGMTDWKRIKDIPELVLLLSPKVAFPSTSKGCPSCK